MKLLLSESIRGVGKRGEIIDVAKGYARNYLIPQGLAYEASDENLLRLEREKRSYDARMANEREKAQEIADAIAKVQLTVRMRTSGDGRLYGSVTPRIIADAFAAENITVDTKDILIENDHIREEGVFSFKVHLHDDIEAESRIWVVSEDAREDFDPTAEPEAEGETEAAEEPAAEASDEEE